MTSRTALVLTGGGARAAYQAGALFALGEILPEQTIPFQTLCGTSAGGINTAFLASRADNWRKATGDLHDIWRNLKLHNVYSTGNLTFSAIALAWVSRTLSGGRGGTHRIANFLLDTQPLEDLITREIDFNSIPFHIESRRVRACSITAVQYSAQLTISFYDGHPEIQGWERAGRIGIRQRLDVRHVMASAAMPIFFPPIAIGNSYFGDGCLRQTNPLSPAIHLGADRILCIGIRPVKKFAKARAARELRQAPTLAEIGGEVLNSIFLDFMDADIERMRRINENVRIAREHGIENPHRLREIPILSLAPSRNLSDILPVLLKKFPPMPRYLFRGIGVSDRTNQGQDLISYFAFFKECIQPLAELGYEDTRTRREEILKFFEG